MKQKLYKVKVQRPLFQPDAPVLIYSKCGTIPPTQLPNEGALKEALGDDQKAYFECSVEGTILQLRRRLRHQHW